LRHFSASFGLRAKFTAKSSEICIELTLLWAKGEAALSAPDLVPD
jgi:hypothetical protein